MTAAGETTWYDFAKAILEEAGTIEPSIPWFAAATGGLGLITRRVIPIPAIEYPTPARRPAYSILSNERMTRVFSVRMPDWQAQLSSVFGGHGPKDL